MQPRSGIPLRHSAVIKCLRLLQGNALVMRASGVVIAERCSTAPLACCLPNIPIAHGGITVSSAIMAERIRR